jgi:hypothetical protein
MKKLNKTTRTVRTHTTDKEMERLMLLSAIISSSMV